MFCVHICAMLSVCNYVRLVAVTIAMIFSVPSSGGAKGGRETVISKLMGQQ